MKVLRVVFPACLLMAGLAGMVQCGAGRDEALTQVQSALVATERSSWWKVACTDCAADSPVALGAFTTAGRGTELFAMVPGSISGVSASRTRSNIERKFAGSAGDPASKDLSSVAVASTDSGTTVDVFYRLTDQTIATRSWNGSFFGSATALPVGFLLADVGAAWKASRVDVFGIGLDHGLYQAYRTTSWNGWYNLPNPSGVTLSSLQPAALWLPSGPIHVFAVGNDGTVRTMNNPGGFTWSAWSSLAGNVSSGLAVTFSGTSRIDLFGVHAGTGDIDWRSSDNNGSSWQSWVTIAAPAAGVMTTTIDGVVRYVAPTAIARGDGAIDLFIRDANGNIQLMTIRPQSTQSGNKERVIATAPPACGNLTGGWGENTGVAAGGCEYLSFGDWGILQVPEASCFLNGPPPASCTTPSGASIPTCAPAFELRFKGNARYGTTVAGLPGQDVVIPAPPYPGFTFVDNSFFGQDNQIVRLGNGNVIALHHYGSTCSEPACSPVPQNAFCPGGSPRTAADVIIRTTPTANCQNTWTYRGNVNPCHILDPGTANNCFNTADHCNLGTGTDRPEMAARGNDLFVAETVIPDADWGRQFAGLFKSTDEGANWTEWVQSTTGRISPPPPLVLTTVGSHLVRFGRTANNATLWSQSATTKQDPTQTVLSSTDVFVLEFGDTPSLVQSAFSVALAGSSADGDYVRVVYATLVSGKQMIKTGIVRVNANETATLLTDSVTTICASTSPGTCNQGSVLYATLIEAERTTGANGDERPPMVLFWVETTKTPPQTDPTCGHGPYVTGQCDWGTISIKATVFRGGAQSPVYTVSTASSTAWRGNGDYVHGGSRNVNGADRFFLHWYNENSSGARLPMARLFDAAR